MSFDLNKNIEKLTAFLTNLIEIKEIGLAKKVFDIANEYKFIATITHFHYSFNEYLAQILITGNFDTFRTLLSFIGELKFIIAFKKFVVDKSNTYYIKK